MFMLYKDATSEDPSSIVIEDQLTTILSVLDVRPGNEGINTATLHVLVLMFKIYLCVFR